MIWVMNEEKWLPLVGYEGKYEVSSLGRCRRACRGKNTYVGRIITPKRNGYGYWYWTLSSGGPNRKMSSVKIHRSVARAFLGEPPDRLIVHHKNGDKNDNRLENLEYATRSANAVHGWDGRRNVPLGKKYALLEALRTLPYGRERAFLLRTFAAVHNVSMSYVYQLTRGVSCPES